MGIGLLVVSYWLLVIGLWFLVLDLCVNGVRMQDFKKLQVWHKAHQLTLGVYEATQAFPKEELYGLMSQMRRCSASIPANIAEGCGRNSEAELARFLHIAMGSASELEYHLIFTHDLNYLDTPDHKRLTSQTTEVKRILTGFIKSLKPNR